MLYLQRAILTKKEFFGHQIDIQLVSLVSIRSMRYITIWECKIYDRVRDHFYMFRKSDIVSPIETLPRFLRRPIYMRVEQPVRSLTGARIYSIQAGRFLNCSKHYMDPALEVTRS